MRQPGKRASQLSAHLASALSRRAELFPCPLPVTARKETSCQWLRHTIHLYSMPVDLTLAQQRVLDFLVARGASGENAPTYREICKSLGYRSPKGAADHIAALERKGYVIRERGHARGIK